MANGFTLNDIYGKVDILDMMIGNSVKKKNANIRKKLQVALIKE